MWRAAAVIIPLTALTLTAIGGAQTMNDRTDGRDARSDTWVAKDALGRDLPGHENCGPPREGKFVGIFYFTWLGPHGYDRSTPLRPDQGTQPKTDEDYQSPYDLAKILAGEQEWGPWHAFHWWGEPQFGYYLTDDEWVLRKHAHMLSEAGVDVIFCDVTNALTYTANYMTICRVFQEIRDEGGRTPQIGFLANAGAPQVVRKLYDEFYSKGLYDDLWFRWRGKPMILTPPEDLDAELVDFFTIRRSWAWSAAGWFGDGKDKWAWLDHHPQKWGWHDGPEHREQVPVAVAQHSTTNIGRSFHDGKQPPPEELQTDIGLCFAEQFERAIEIDPEFIFITGWNEWAAMRFESNGDQSIAGEVVPKGGSIFVDQYSQEYSRDIEPMRDGHGDNYYYQMVDGIRRFKGVRAPSPTSAPRTIRVDGEFGDWDDVEPEFLDTAGDTTHRDHPGWGSAGPYVDTTGRNDIVAAKVARDADNIYFYVETRDPLTPHTDPNWMWLLISIGGEDGPNWEGYQYVVNRRGVGSSRASLERNLGGWNWERVSRVAYAASGNQLEVAIPRTDLALGDESLQIDFKWVDNAQKPGDIMDFITSGDAAPSGRFNFRYKES